MIITGRTAVSLFFSMLLLPAAAQVKKEGTELKREVTLYNPYKPSLIEVRKKSYLPEIIDTVRIIPSFSYQVTSSPYSPVLAISPIKPASLLSDPLSRLYKGYIRIGLGNYTTPLAELSVANTRSKKGALGFNGRHYSSNGMLKLPDSPEKVPAGFMDNDASLFGKKFFNRSVLGLSLDYTGKTRYAYGYNSEDPQYIYVPGKKNIRTGYFDLGAKASFASLNLDSADFSYDFSVAYDYFRYTRYMTMNHAGLTGSMAKNFKGFYVGSGLAFDHYSLSDSIGMNPKFIFVASPFVRKSTAQWEFNLGLGLALEKNLTIETKAHLFPDLRFGFSIVSGYMRFFASLSGKIEDNNPGRVFDMNPYLKPDGSIFRVPNTKYPLIVTGGLKGNDGIGGNYVASVSYSAVKDMILFSNINYPDTLGTIERGNYFTVLADDAEMLNIHGELTGEISSRLSFRAGANFYRYTLSANAYAWNKPDWDGSLDFTYNLRNKIIAGVGFNALGKREVLIRQSSTGWSTLQPVVKELPAHLNLSLSTEYRYTKILSFWARLNNVSYNRYYEWAYYPSQMFNFMVGFSYSL